MNIRFKFWIFLSFSVGLASCDYPMVKLEPTPKLQLLKVSCEHSELPTNVIAPCEAVGTYSDGSTALLTTHAEWTSENPRVLATAHHAHRSWLRGVAPGTSEVIARIGPIAGSAQVTVTPLTPVAINVSPSSPSLKVGEIEQLSCTAIFSDGSYYDVSHSATWTV